MQIAFAPEEIVAAVQPIGRRGATGRTITGIAGLDLAEPGDLSFLANTRYRTEVAHTRASVVFLPPKFEGEPGPDQLFLIVDNPSVALAKVCAVLERRLWPAVSAGVHTTACVDSAARVAASASIGPHCVVEAGAVIGERCFLQAGVFIGRGAQVGDDCRLLAGSIVATECVLGRRVQLNHGAVVGADGFGYEMIGGKYDKLPQVGDVVLGDDVEVGANSTIDRARFARTVIGEGTKIDNLVQIGHNCRTGRHCLICAQAGLAGSTVLEDYVVLGGQVGTAGHLKLGKGVQVGAQSGINRDWAAGTHLRGTPALPFMEEQRIQVLRNRLPDLFKRVAALEERASGVDT